MPDCLWFASPLKTAENQNFQFLPPGNKISITPKHNRSLVYRGSRRESAHYSRLHSTHA